MTCPHLALASSFLCDLTGLPVSSSGQLGTARCVTPSRVTHLPDDPVLHCSSGICLRGFARQGRCDRRLCRPNHRRQGDAAREVLMHRISCQPSKNSRILPSLTRSLLRAFAGRRKKRMRRHRDRRATSVDLL
jgi:hypothetical protein